MNLWNKLREHFVGRPLNCQPGDMAVIVRMPGPETSVLIGRVIRVTSLVIDGGDACCDETLDWLPVPGRAREVA